MSTINPKDYLLMRLFKFETLEKVLARAFASTCKLENSKGVRNEHQHTKTTEDEECLYEECLFCINVYPPVEKYHHLYIESWPEWDLNSRPLNSVQTL